MTAPRMKDVTYQDGQLYFRLPDGWESTEEADGTRAFYDESADGGTLRLKLMTFTAQADLSLPVAFRELQSMQPEPGQTVEALPDGNALRCHREETVVAGEATVLHIWLLASVDPPHRMHLAVFSLTMLADHAEGLPARRMVATLDREIRGARFAHQLS
jgi:hypothetical protein